MALALNHVIAEGDETMYGGWGWGREDRGEKDHLNIWKRVCVRVCLNGCK